MIRYPGSFPRLFYYYSGTFFLSLSEEKKIPKIGEFLPALMLGVVIFESV